MPRLPFWDSVKDGAVQGAEYGALVSVFLMGASSTMTLYVLATSEDRACQYAVICAMYQAYDAALKIPGASAVIGAFKGAANYYVDSLLEEAENNHRHAI